MQDLERIYGEDFYRNQMDDSYKSAKIYAARLAAIIKVESVVDVGCGRGTWLKAFREAGAARLVGFDGHWNSQANMIDGTIAFNAADLNRPLPISQERFDLAMSLEVAEHLAPAAAAGFVESLTGLSDVILFGAAFTGQGGKNHVNEQRPTYWARLFMARGYLPFDVLRPMFWGDERVCFWYRQNTFLYVNEGSNALGRLKAQGHAPMSDIAFMDCIHPDLYFRYTRQSARLGFRMIRHSIARGIGGWFGRRRVQ